MEHTSMASAIDCSDLPNRVRILLTPVERLADRTGSASLRHFARVPSHAYNAGLTPLPARVALRVGIRRVRRVHSPLSGKVMMTRAVIVIYYGRLTMRGVPNGGTQPHHREDAMHARYLTVGIGLVLIWASAGTSAEVPSQDDTTMQVICSFSTTFADGVESHIDTNNDGVSAVLDHAISNCNIGRFFISGAAEYQAPLSPPETCPAGSTLEFRLQQARGVGIEERTGD
jgi:hypothetical protein